MQRFGGSSCAGHDRNGGNQHNIHEGTHDNNLDNNNDIHDDDSAAHHDDNRSGRDRDVTGRAG
jgi:hypothetical protein